MTHENNPIGMLRYVKLCQDNQLYNEVIKYNIPGKDCVKQSYYINMVHIKKEYRGKGLSKLLFTNLLKSKSDLILEVENNNQTAINLYLSLGFSIIDSKNGITLMIKHSSQQRQ